MVVKAVVARLLMTAGMAAVSQGTSIALNHVRERRRRMRKVSLAEHAETVRAGLQKSGLVDPSVEQAIRQLDDLAQEAKAMGL